MHVLKHIFWLLPWLTTKARQRTVQGTMTGTVDRLLICAGVSSYHGACTILVPADSVAGVEFECSVVEYPSFIANLPTLQEPHYVLYTADTDDATKQPWCPDCQQADPIVEEIIKERGGTLLKVKVSSYALQQSSSCKSPCCQAIRVCTHLSS